MRINGFVLFFSLPDAHISHIAQDQVEILIFSCSFLMVSFLCFHQAMNFSVISPAFGHSTKMLLIFHRCLPIFEVTVPFHKQQNLLHFPYVVLTKLYASLLLLHNYYNTLHTCSPSLIIVPAMHAISVYLAVCSSAGRNKRNKSSINIFYTALHVC